MLWNSANRIEVNAFGTGHQSFVNAQCPVSNCDLVANSSEFWTRVTKSNYTLLETFDAIIFNLHELWLTFLFPDEYRRPVHQRVVFLTQESPLTMAAMGLDVSRLHNIFNWTMTYKLDSDIQLLYGRVHPKINSTYHIRPIKNGTMNRSQVVWMVSHCKTFSKRENYVTELAKYIQVDVYGGCGNFTCPRNEGHWISDPECYAKLAAKYKFYLSFENSICTDYVTEKFFNILQHDMVPIVMGGADYASIAPPHSYINALKFNGPKELAKYLNFLERNQELYEEYFYWKKWFSVEAGVNQMARHAFCDLCAKLHDPAETDKVYSNTSLISSWGPKSQCLGTWNVSSLGMYLHYPKMVK